MRLTPQFNSDGESPKKQLVLVIDDDKNFVKSTGTTLEEFGYDVLVAHDGNTGIANAIARRPDVILLEARIPKRSGFLVLEYLRTQTDIDCPVIFLCDFQGDRHEKYAKLLGASLYVCKPVSGKELAQMANGLLGKDEVSAAIATPMKRARKNGRKPR